MSSSNPMRLLLLVALNALLIPPVYAAQVDRYSAYPATAGIPTGMIKLGSSDSVVPPTNATIDWGDGHTSVALMDCSLNVLTTHCDYWGHQHIYASPGLYSVVVTNNNGDSTQPKPLPVVAIGNFVIASIGDSVASGEGNPTVPSSTSHQAYWDYQSCHGSSNSGPAIAARMIIKDNPAARVTFIHLACSGAKISGDSTLPDNAYGQLFELKDLLPAGTKIDTLMITVGANNVDGGFSNVVNTCIGPYPTKENPLVTPDPTLDCTTSNDADSVKMRNELKDIPYKDYSPLADMIQSGNLNVSDEDVYITNYFDPTHDSAGNFPSREESTLCSGDLMLPDEWAYLYNNMLLPLNAKIKNVADQYGWHHVRNIATDFKQHGYCIGSSGVSWVVSLPESLVTQGDTTGTSHPNSLGQYNYATHIVDAIYAWNLPVTTATATTDGGHYTFGTWTYDDVMVTLSATNKLDAAGTDKTKYSIDEPACSDADTGACMDYAGAFPITGSGFHTLYFFSNNTSGNFEKVKTAQIMIDKPLVYDDSIDTTIDQKVSGQLQAINPNSNDTLTFNIVTQPDHGTVILTDVSKGTFTYMPAPGYAGNDSFTFMLNNGYVDSSIATESLTIADNPPVAQDDSASTPSGKAVSGQLQASDPDGGQTLTYDIVSQPNHGTVSLEDMHQGSYSYTPDAGYSGKDSFTFKVNDGYLDSNTATESVTVTAAATSGSPPSGGDSASSGALGPWGLCALALLAGLRFPWQRRYHGAH